MLSPLNFEKKVQGKRPKPFVRCVWCQDVTTRIMFKRTGGFLFEKCRRRHVGEAGGSTVRPDGSEGGSELVEKKVKSWRWRKKEAGERPIEEGVVGMEGRQSMDEKREKEKAVRGKRKRDALVEMYGEDVVEEYGEELGLEGDKSVGRRRRRRM